MPAQRADLWLAGVITVEVIEARLPRRLSVTKREKPLNPYAAIVVGHSHVAIRCIAATGSTALAARLQRRQNLMQQHRAAQHIAVCLLNLRSVCFALWLAPAGNRVKALALPLQQQAIPDLSKTRCWSGCYFRCARSVLWLPPALPM